MLEGRIVVSGVIFAIFVSAVVIALVYFAPGARMLPLVIGVPGVILSAIQLIAELRRTGAKKISPQVRRGEVIMVIWFGVFAAGIVAFGFKLAGPVLIAAYLLIAGRERWYTALIGAVLAWLILEFVFEQFIGILLFEGFVPPMLLWY